MDINNNYSSKFRVECPNCNQNFIMGVQCGEIEKEIKCICIRCGSVMTIAKGITSSVCGSSDLDAMKSKYPIGTIVEYTGSCDNHFIGVISEKEDLKPYEVGVRIIKALGKTSMVEKIIENTVYKVNIFDNYLHKIDREIEEIEDADENTSCECVDNVKNESESSAQFLIRETDFMHDLEKLINKHSMENGSDTPDFILAEFLGNILWAMNKCINDRNKWYKKE